MENRPVLLLLQDNLKMIHNKKLLQTFSSLILGILLLFSHTKNASAAACNIYNSMTTTVKNVSNWATACSIAFVDGVDNGSSDAVVANTATLSLTTGGALTINSGGALNLGTLTVGAGSIVVQAGGAINLSTGIWIKDADADGWAHNFTTTSEFLSATASGSRRLGLMKDYSVDTSANDCNDTAVTGFSLTNTCYSYAQSTYYAYSQSNYYNYSQSSYYAYSQSTYYGYGQANYYNYAQGYYCFLSGTKILLANGTYKEIQDIVPGDEVLSYNTQTGKTIKEKVEKLIIHKNILGRYLTINDTLKVTANHPIYLNGSWQEAGKAKIGDKLVNSNGQVITITSITISGEGVNNLYNLHLVGSDHNYFAQDILVHNK